MAKKKEVQEAPKDNVLDAIKMLAKERGIDEEELKRQFSERAKSETKIAEKEKELKKLVKKWDEDGLLNPYLFNYSRQWSVADRLKSLYNTRETIIKMFTKDGELQMGAYKGKMTEEEFIEELVYKWTYFGIKDRAKFYKWLEDEKIVKKPVPKEIEDKPERICPAKPVISKRT